MVSCTEFIPLYSELFKYIEDKADHDAVVTYWKHISDVYVRCRLGKLAEQKGLAGCWEYWTRALNEEAADFVITYDDEAQTYESNMRYCPSRGLLNELIHMEPYHDYCGHCDVLYAPILAEYGIRNTGRWVDGENARCRNGYYIPKKETEEK